MRAHKDEMEELYEKYLTKAMKAKLNLQQQAVVKAAILEKAILAEVDHKAKDIEKELTKEIRDIVKNLWTSKNTKRGYANESEKVNMHGIES